jgi:hypothetical protein
MGGSPTADSDGEGEAWTLRGYRRGGVRHGPWGDTEKEGEAWALRGYRGGVRYGEGAMGRYRGGGEAWPYGDTEGGEA